VREGNPNPSDNTFEDTTAINGNVFLGKLLEDREHHVLLAQGACVLNLQLLGIGKEISRRFLFQFLKVHGLDTLVTAGKTGWPVNIRGAPGSGGIYDRFCQCTSIAMSSRLNFQTGFTTAMTTMMIISPVGTSFQIPVGAGWPWRRITFQLPTHF
jgi:hypothetical protein